MRHLLITDPGLERIAAEEARGLVPVARADPEPYGCPGHVRVEGATAAGLLGLSTIHHVIEILHEDEAASLDDARRVAAGTPVPALEAARSFRVSSTLVGEHPFRREELAGAVGAALVGRHGTPVDLEGFEVNVRADLFGSRLVLGVQRTTVSLGNRIRRAQALRSALKPTIAAAMVRIAGAHEGPGRLIDPLCGAGTIPIEALRANATLDVRAADWDDATVEVARRTLRNHDLDLDVRVCDARQLHRAYHERFDYIVTDPPYGVRQARRTRLRELYASLLPSFEAVLAEGGCVVVAVVKRHAFLSAVERGGLAVGRETRVDSGGLPLRIYRLERG